MDFGKYMDNLLDFRKDAIESEIKKAITDTKMELKGLDVERTCKVYTSYLYYYLKKRNILCHIVDTEIDLGLKYQHQFVIVPNRDDFYVVDLTYGQFRINSMFNKLYCDGYQLFDKNLLNKYIDNINKSVKKRSKR